MKRYRFANLTFATLTLTARLILTFTARLACTTSLIMIQTVHQPDE